MSPALWLLPLMLSAGGDVAPPIDAQPVTLGEARARAVRGGPEVQLARQRELDVRALLVVVGALPIPYVGGTTARLTARLTTSLRHPRPLVGQRGSSVDAARADADVAHLD